MELARRRADIIRTFQKRRERGAVTGDIAALAGEPGLSELDELGVVDVSAK